MVSRWRRRFKLLLNTEQVLSYLAISTWATTSSHNSYMGSKSHHKTSENEMNTHKKGKLSENI